MVGARTLLYSSAQLGRRNRLSCADGHSRRVVSSLDAFNKRTWFEFRKMLGAILIGDNGQLSVLRTVTKWAGRTRFRCRNT